MNVTEIRRGLAERLDTIPDLHGSAFVPDSISTVTACVLPGDPYIDYHGTFGPERMATISLEVLVLCPKNIDFDWQEKLDAYCSTGTDEPLSLVDVIEADATLDVVGLSCLVTGAHSWGTTTVGDIAYGSVKLGVRAYLNRS